jgi:hypothetical protein
MRYIEDTNLNMLCFFYNEMALRLHNQGMFCRFCSKTQFSLPAFSHH